MQEGRKAGKFIRWAIALVAVYILVAVSRMAQAQPVYFNPANAVGSGHASLIKFAAWSWAERTGMDVAYAGTTTAAECVANAVTYRTASLAEWNMAMDAVQATDGERLGFRAFTFECPPRIGYGYTILLSPHFPINRVTAIHELGHGLRGFGHPGSYYAVMNAAAPAEALITDTDVDYILASPDWPAPFPASRCHVEVAPDMDLAITEVDDKRVRLNYEGLVAGYHTWSVAMAETIYGSSAGCTNAVMQYNGDLVLNDVRSEAGNYSAANLQYMGGTTWRLVGLTP